MHPRFFFCGCWACRLQGFLFFCTSLKFVWLSYAVKCESCSGCNLWRTLLFFLFVLMYLRLVLLFGICFFLKVVISIWSILCLMLGADMLFESVSLALLICNVISRQ